MQRTVSRAMHAAAAAPEPTALHGGGVRSRYFLSRDDAACHMVFLFFFTHWHAATYLLGLATFIVNCSWYSAGSGQQRLNAHEVDAQPGNSRSSSMSWSCSSVSALR